MVIVVTAGKGHPTMGHFLVSSRHKEWETETRVVASKPPLWFAGICRAARPWLCLGAFTLEVVSDLMGTRGKLWG